jgi:hypothetical protein
MKTALAASLLLLTSLAFANDPPAGADRYGHAPDYTWVKGELIRSDIEGGFWSVRYIPAGPEAEKDPHGGRFVLGNPPQLKGFASGQFVKITGRIAEDQASIFMAGTLYDLATVERQDAAPPPRPPGGTDRRATCHAQEADGRAG